MKKSELYMIPIVIFFIFSVVFSVDISSCTSITSPGFYRITADLVGDSCLRITSNDVFIECDGHWVNATTSTNYPVTQDSGLTNATLNNCKLFGSLSSMYGEVSLKKSHIVSTQSVSNDISVDSCYFESSVMSSGDMTAYNSTFFGLNVQNRFNVTKCTIYGDLRIRSSSRDNQLKDLIVTGSTAGFYVNEYQSGGTCPFLDNVTVSGKSVLYVRDGSIPAGPINIDDYGGVLICNATASDRQFSSKSWVSNSGVFIHLSEDPNNHVEFMTLMMGNDSYFVLGGSGSFKVYGAEFSQDAYFKINSFTMYSNSTIYDLTYNYENNFERIAFGLNSINSQNGAYLNIYDLDLVNRYISMGEDLKNILVYDISIQAYYYSIYMSTVQLDNVIFKDSKFVGGSRFGVYHVLSSSTPGIKMSNVTFDSHSLYLFSSSPINIEVHNITVLNANDNHLCGGGSIRESYFENSSIYFDDTTSLEISNSTFEYSTFYVQNSGNNNTVKIFNNLMVNVTVSCSSAEQQWNTTITSERNIVNGPKVGGNYWTNDAGSGYSDTCLDSQNDGFCDDPFVLCGNNIDYLPLSNYTALSSPPIVEIFSPSEGTIYSTTSISLEYTAIDPDGSVVECWYKLDNGSSVDLPNCENTTVTVGSGTHTIEVFAKDDVSKVNSSAVTFTVDIFPPKVSILSPKNETVSEDGNFLLWISPSDNESYVSSCLYYVSGTSANYTIPDCNSTNIYIDSIGYYNVTVYVRDSVGHWASSTVYNILRDKVRNITISGNKWLPGYYYMYVPGCEDFDEYRFMKRNVTVTAEEPIEYIKISPSQNVLNDDTCYSSECNFVVVRGTKTYSDLSNFTFVVEVKFPDGITRYYQYNMTVYSPDSVQVGSWASSYVYRREYLVVQTNNSYIYNENSNIFGSHALELPISYPFSESSGFELYPVDIDSEGVINPASNGVHKYYLGNYSLFWDLDTGYSSSRYRRHAPLIKLIDPEGNYLYLALNYPCPYNNYSFSYYSHYYWIIPRAEAMPTVDVNIFDKDNYDTTSEISVKVDIFDPRTGTISGDDLMDNVYLYYKDYFGDGYLVINKSGSYYINRTGFPQYHNYSIYFNMFVEFAKNETSELGNFTKYIVPENEKAPDIFVNVSELYPNVYDNVTIETQANDTWGARLDTIKIYVDSSLVKTCNYGGVDSGTCTLDTYFNSSGIHNITSVACDTQNNCNTKKTTLSVFDDPPENLQVHTDGSSATKPCTPVSIWGTVQDDGHIEKMEIWVDGELVKSCDNMQSFRSASCGVQYTETTTSPHRVFINATDEAGQTVSKEATFDYGNVVDFDYTVYPEEVERNENMHISGWVLLADVPLASKLVWKISSTDPITVCYDPPSGNITDVPLNVPNGVSCSNLANVTFDTVLNATELGDYWVGYVTEIRPCAWTPTSAGGLYHIKSLVSVAPIITVNMMGYIGLGDTNTISVHAEDSSGMAWIKIYVDSSLVKTCNYGGEIQATCTYVAGPYNTEGMHSVYAEASDVDGKQSSSDTYYFRVSDYPDVYVSVNDTYAVVGDWVRITGTAYDSDGINQIRLFINGTQVSQCSSSPCTYDTTFSEPGNYSIKAWAEDTKGLSNEYEIYLIVHSSNEPPEVSISYNDSTVLVNESVEITVEANSPNEINRIDIGIEGSVVKTCYNVTVCKYVTQFGSAGNYDVFGNATDSNGNYTVEHSTLTVYASDSVPPVVSVFVNDTAPLVGEPVGITVSADDEYGISEIKIKVNGTVIKQCSSSPCSVIKVFNDTGYYVVQGEALDNNSNLGYDDEGVTVSQYSDNTPPSVDISAIKSIWYENERITVNLYASDDTYLSYTNVSYREVNSTNWVWLTGYDNTGQSSFSATYGFYLGTGDYVIRQCSVDVVGNTACDDLSITVLPNTSLPSTPSIGGGGGGAPAERHAYFIRFVLDPEVQHLSVFEPPGKIVFSKDVSSGDVIQFAEGYKVFVFTKEGYSPYVYDTNVIMDSTIRSFLQKKEYDVKFILDPPVQFLRVYSDGNVTFEGFIENSTTIGLNEGDYRFEFSAEGMKPTSITDHISSDITYTVTLSPTSGGKIGILPLVVVTLIIVGAGVLMSEA